MQKGEAKRDVALSWDVPAALGAEYQEAAVAGSRQAFAQVAASHLHALVEQLLAAEGVAEPGVWAPQLVKRLVGAGGEPADSRVVAGVACRKHVAHKRMRTAIAQPRVMVLGGSLEFSRSGGAGAPSASKLSSFDALMDQEAEYLRGCVERIAALHPDVLLVERSVARSAQELLLEKNISLVLGIKPELLQRIACCIQAEVAPSVDQLSTQCVGTCKEFEVESWHPMPTTSSMNLLGGVAAGAAAGSAAASPAGASHGGGATPITDASEPGEAPLTTAGSFDLLGPAAAPAALAAAPAALAGAAAARLAPAAPGPRPLMVFSGCPRPLGAAILLRGADAAQLAPLKRVAGFAAYAAYWGRLEAAFLADQLLAAASSVVPSSLGGLPAAHSEMLAGIAEAVASSSYLTVVEQRGRQAIVSASPHVSVFHERGSRALAALQLPEPAAGGGGVGTGDGPAPDVLLPGFASTESDPWGLPLSSATTITVSGTQASSGGGTAAEEAAGAAQREHDGGEAEVPRPSTPLPILTQQQGQGQQLLPPPSPQDPLSRAAKEAAAAEEASALSSPGDVSPHAPSDVPSTAGGLSRLSGPGSTVGGAGAAEQALGGEEEPGAPAGRPFHPGTAIYDLQQLWLAISCKNPAKSVLCEPPHSHCMEFYASVDLPLAAFLAAAAPSNRKCPHPQCGDGASLHLRSFLRGDGLVTLSSVRLPAGKELPEAERGQVWLWARPLARGPGAAAAALRLPLSAEAACLSFAHLLALLLDARHLAVGGMSLQRDFVRYLGAGPTVLCLHYSHVAPFDVALPPRDLAVEPSLEAAWLQDEVKSLTEEGDEAFTAIEFALAEQLQQLGSNDLEFAQVVGWGAREMWLDTLAETRSVFLDLVQQTGLLLDGPALRAAKLDGREGSAAGSSPGGGGGGGNEADATVAADDVGSCIEVVWALNRVRRLLASVVHQWATALAEGTPAARAAPPTAVALPDSARQRYSRHGSLEVMERAPSAGEPLPAAEAPPEQQQQQQQAGAEAPPTDQRDHGHLDGSLPLAPYARRSRSFSLGQQFVDAVAAQQHRQSTPLPITDAAYAAPSLRDSSAATSSPAQASPGAGRAEPLRDVIPTGLVARFVALYDAGSSFSSSSKGGGAGVPGNAAACRQGPSQQRTRDWVSRSSAEPDEALPSTGPPAAEAAAGPAGNQQEQEQERPWAWGHRRQWQPAEDEEGGSTSEAGEEEEEEEDRGLLLGRRPSFFIDLTQVDNQLSSSATPSRAVSNPDELAQGEGSASKLEQLTARLSRMSLSQSFTERRNSMQAMARRTSLGSAGSEGERAFLPAVQESAQGEPSLPPPEQQQQQQQQQQQKQEGAQVAKPLSTAASGGPASLSSAVSSSHFDEWRAVLARDGAAAPASSVAEPANSSADAFAVPLASPPRDVSAKPAAAQEQGAQQEQAGLSPLAPLASSPGRPPAPIQAAPPSLAGPAAVRVAAVSGGIGSERTPSTPKAGAQAEAAAAAPQQQQQPVPSRLKQLLARLGAPGPEVAAPALRPLCAGLLELSGRPLLPPVADGVAVTVFDGEPTSIVAYFLATREYQQYLRDAVATILHGEVGAPSSSSAAATASDAGAGAPDAAAPLPPSWQAGPRAAAAPADAVAAAPAAGADAVADAGGAGAGVVPAAGAATGASGTAGLGSSWRVLLAEQQQDCQLVVEDPSAGAPTGPARFTATAYYAPQFADLRARVVEGGEPAFLASISRCVKWASRGGKSAAYFARSKDERYVIKQLSRSERQSFLEFAPHYFRHVAAALARGGDTCLAKILGVYQVSVQYTGGKGAPAAPPFGGREGTMDLLVHRIYDLKGSERDRYAADDPTMVGAVLLDENLRELNLSCPTAVGPSAYARLQRALWSDTAFLAGLGVMDYSLLVGVDRRRQELVVGVIDFIRQYTWDKQVETWVKKSGILGGAGKDPTVISPKQYCRRFRAAMASYFTVVPSLLAPEPPLDPDAA
eukprot:scaffold1.g5551.t1